MKLNYIKLILVFSSILLLTTEAFCGISYKYWEYSKSIKIINNSKKVVAVPLDHQVYNSAKSDLNDLRVLDANNKEIPYALFVQDEVKKEKRLQTKIVSKQVSQTDSSIVMEFSEPVNSFNSIKIIPESKNFVRKIDIEGSDDNNSWKMIRKGIIVYSLLLEAHQTYLERYTNEVYAGYSFERYSEENLSVQFPESNYKFLRLRIPHDKDKEPVELKDVEVFKTIKTSAEENVFKGDIVKSQINPDSKSVDYIVDFGFKNLPLSRINIATGSSNFFRNVETETSNDSEKWEKAGTGVIFSISIDEETKDNLILTFKEKRCRYLKIRVFNGDNKPIKLTSVTGYGLKQFVALIPEKELRYTIIYGNDFGKPVSYDVANLLTEKTLSSFGTGILGDQIRNEKFEAYKEPKPWTENKPYVLWIAMGIIGFGLIFLGFQVVKKIS